MNQVAMFWTILTALEDVRPVRGYPKSVELRSFVLSWRPIDWYRLASHPVRGKLQLWTIDAPERERPVWTEPRSLTLCLDEELHWHDLYEDKPNDEGTCRVVRDE